MMRLNRWVVLVTALVGFSIACGSATATSAPADQEVAATEAPAEPTTIPPTNTPKPTSTSKPTNTPKPPTATKDPNIIGPGTFLVGSEINAGLYVGQAGTDLGGSCYWERKKDLSGGFRSILANDNAIGRFYIEVLETDKALQVDCEVRYLPELPAPVDPFPDILVPGTYLVGIDMKPGTYKGQASGDFGCYWERLRNLTGGFDSIIANDNAEGQYYIEVKNSDKALYTDCEVAFVSE